MPVSSALAELARSPDSTRGGGGRTRTRGGSDERDVPDVITCSKHTTSINNNEKEKGPRHLFLEELPIARKKGGGGGDVRVGDEKVLASTTTLSAQVDEDGVRVVVAHTADEAPADVNRAARDARREWLGVLHEATTAAAARRKKKEKERELLPRVALAGKKQQNDGSLLLDDNNDDKATAAAATAAASTSGATSPRTPPGVHNPCGGSSSPSPPQPQSLSTPSPPRSAAPPRRLQRLVSWQQDTTAVYVRVAVPR